MKEKTEIYVRVNGFTKVAKEGSFMDKIGAYSAYQKTYAESVKSKKNQEISAKKTEESSKAQETNKTSAKEQVTLSDRAKELLKELQKKYGNMDFIVADYKTDEEASALLARGTKEFSVLIEPDVLEQMAADEEVKAKYINLIEESTSQLNGIKEQLGDAGEEVKRLGISVGDDGTVDFFAELEKMSEKQKERIQNAKEVRKEEKAEEKKEAEEKRLEELLENKENVWNGNGKHKTLFFQAASAEELLEKIRNVDWSSVEATEVEVSGKRFDFTI